jgi:hypothetical protein
MTREEKLIIMKDRYNKLAGTPKNIKAPGVVKKLKRQIRNMESK